MRVSSKGKSDWFYWGHWGMCHHTQFMHGDLKLLSRSCSSNTMTTSNSNSDKPIAEENADKSLQMIVENDR